MKGGSNGLLRDAAWAGRPNILNFGAVDKYIITMESCSHLHNGHWQHAISRVVDVLPDQVDAPCRAGRGMARVASSQPRNGSEGEQG
eukprot:208155-Chlamydomonas_euryale.AAC.1